MEGSLYPNGVLVDQSALRRTETTKAEHIMKNRVYLSSRGVISGGGVTVNGTSSDRVDVAPFSGYTPRGDFVESSAINYSVSLSDYTLGTINIVCAVYYETNSKSQPHETDGSTYPTLASASYRIRVFTEAEFAALDSTNDNLANDAVDRCLLLAKVTAEGTGAALITIVRSTEFDNIMYTNPSQLSVLSGVTILAVDPDCPVGTGSVTFDDTGVPTYTFQWASPGGTISAATNVTVDSIITITDGAGYWIKLQVIISQLPLGLAVPYAESFTISNLYAQELPALTGEDILHRNYTGTGIVSTVNPHGQSLDDFAGSSLTLLDEHQDIMHCNGIWRGSSSSIFLGSINTATPSGDTISIIQPTNADLFYINGKRLQSANPSSFIFNAASFTAGSLGATVKEGMKLYEFYVDDSEVTIAHLRAKGPESTTRNATGVFIVNMSQGHPAGTFNLEYEVTAGTTIEYRWDSGPIVSRIKPGDYDQVIRLYRPNGIDWVEVLYADDASSGDEWVKAATGTYSDPVVVYAEKDRSQNMQILSLPYWYNGSSAKGQLGLPPYGLSRTVVDRRIFGNLCKSEMADLNLQEIVYHPQDEMHYSGVLINRDSGGEFNMSVTSGLTIGVVGGYYYLRGERGYYSGGAVTVPDNVTSLVYVDLDGSSQVLDVTSDFSGDVSKALEYLSGSSYFRNPVFDTGFVDSNTRSPELGIPLWVIVASAGAINTTTSYNIARNVNGPVDPWSVGAFYSEYNSAFDSLASAFEHASAHMSIGNREEVIEVKVVAPNYIDFSITQPSGVTVIGYDHTDSGKSYVLDRTSGVSTGVWNLSSGNIVKNVKVDASTNGATIFGLDSFVTISDCYCSNFSYNITFASAKTSALANVILSSNYHLSLGVFLSGVTSTSNSSWIIRDNSLIQWGNTISGSGVISVSGFSFKILSNLIYHSGSSGLFSTLDDSSVIGNTIIMNDTSVSGSSYGIYISGDRNTLTGNVVTNSYPTAPTVDSSGKVGVHFPSGASNVSFSGNVVNLTHTGSRGVEVVGFDISISGCDITSKSTGVTTTTAGNSHISISGSKINSESLGMNIACADVNVMDCEVYVTSVSDSGITDSSSAALGSIGIRVFSPRSNISGCKVFLEGEVSGSDRVLRSASACLYLDYGSSTITGCSFHQWYTQLSASTAAAYFVYLDKAEGSNIFSNNSINSDNVGSSLIPYPSYSHGLYINSQSSGRSLFNLQNNTIGAAHFPGTNTAIVTPSGTGGAIAIYDLYMISSSGVLAASDRIIAYNNFITLDFIDADSAYSGAYPMTFSSFNVFAGGSYQSVGGASTNYRDEFSALTAGVVNSYTLQSF